MTQPILLASRSPRRADLLLRAGIAFEVGPAPDVDETPPPGVAPPEAVCAIAERKARAVARLAPDRCVLAADTLVFLDDEIYGKPDGAPGARVMLRRLSGRTHRVATGIAVASDGRVETDVEVTAVTFRALDDAEIEAYVRGGEPLDKAGAYAIQEGAAGFVARVEGALDTVVGLPVRRVRGLLARVGRPEGFGT